MADKAVSSECSSHISVNSEGNSVISNCKNCRDYEIQLKEALDELTSTQMINIVYVLLGISPASNCSWPTFRNPVSVPSSKAGRRM
jgi:hypothetical protein